MLGHGSPLAPFLRNPAAVLPLPEADRVADGQDAPSLTLGKRAYPAKFINLPGKQ